MNKTGWLSTDVEWGHFVNFEHPHPDNPQWDSFKFELQSIEPMSEGEWNHWRVSECQRAVELPRN